MHQVKGNHSKSATGAPFSQTFAAGTGQSGKDKGGKDKGG